MEMRKTLNRHVKLVGIAFIITSKHSSKKKKILHPKQRTTKRKKQRALSKKRKKQRGSNRDFSGESDSESNFLPKVYQKGWDPFAKWTNRSQRTHHLGAFDPFLDSSLPVLFFLFFFACSKIQRATQKAICFFLFSSFFLFFNIVCFHRFHGSKPTNLIHQKRPTNLQNFHCFFFLFLFSTAEEALIRKEEKEEMYVYPRVKVRQQEDQDDQYGVHDHVYTPVDKHEDVSPPSVAKIPKSYIPSVAIPTISVPEVAEKTNEKFEEDYQHDIRASSIPRPRAVLSSPNNDVVIGHKNRVKTERRSAQNNHNTVQNRHALYKVNNIPSRTAENSMNMKKSKEVPDESNLKGKKGSAVTLPSQRRNPRTGKPSSTRT